MPCCTYLTSRAAAHTILNSRQVVRESALRRVGWCFKLKFLMHTFICRKINPNWHDQLKLLSNDSDSDPFTLTCTRVETVFALY